VIIECSPAATLLFKLSKPELTGQRPEYLSPPEQAGTASAVQAVLYYQQAIRSGIAQFSWSFLVKNQILATEICYLALSATQLMALIRPVANQTTLSQQNQQLQAERDLYKEMVQSAKDAMLLLEDYRIIAFNQAAMELYARTAEQLLGQHPGILSPQFQADGQSSYQLAERLMANASAGQAQYFRWLHQKPDRSTFVCEVSLQAAKPLPERSPAAKQRFVATARDVSEAARVSEALRQSEQQFRRLFEYAPVAMSLVSLDGTSLSVNKEWCRLFGYSMDDVPTLDHWWVQAYPNPDYRQKVQQMWQQGIQRVATEHVDLNATDLIICAKDGTPRNILVGGTVIGQTILTSFSDMTSQRQAQQSLLALNAQLELRAYSDPLLGIANLNKLIEQLDQLAVQHQSGRLALIDLDHFSAVNDSLGHEFGNLVLQAVTRRLQQLFPDCLIARISSDVFAVLGSHTAIQQHSIQALTQDSFTIADQSIRLTATCGLLELSAAEPSGEVQLQNAHMALKQAKSGQRGHALFFSEKMGLDLRERMRLLSSLREAADQQSFFMQYQPKVDLITGRICGCEALIRWKSANGQLIPPDKFIPLAEQSGMMNAIGNFVLRTACLQLRRLIDLGWDQLCMAINISHSQLSAPDFLQQLSAALELAKVPHHLIELEITETMAAENPKELGALLQKVRDMGLKIAIDDFGIGFSSLSILRHLPVSRLKIDRSFVQEMHEDDRIARMVLSLSQSLGLQTTAEGVETETQHQLLQQLGCHEGQGWLYAKALTEPELVAFLQRQPA
jgi:diguanylate cyclase (GGDEF)-like protein/PAS domain S-box-containing protein